LLGLPTTAQTVSIPDAIFKDALVNENVARLFGDPVLQDVDVNNDGEIQLSEALNVQELYVNNDQTTPTEDKIASLEGIQSFINLEILICSYNLLPELDVTQLTNLQSLSCRNNLLSNLDVSQNVDLILFTCSFNNLVNIDPTFNMALERLRVNNNQITSIDVSQNIAVKDLWVQENELNNLMIQTNSNLEVLSCDNNQLTSLDVSQNPALYFINCFKNQITTLDFSQNPLLERLSCRDNQLVNLNVQNNNNASITRMWAHNNPNLLCINVDNENATYPICDMDAPFTGWCKDGAANYSEDCVLSSEDFNKTIDINVYPVPVTNSLHIVSSIISKIDVVEIYSSHGVLINTIKNASLPKTINTENFAAGIYFVKISMDGNSFYKRIIKK
jgi:Leucine-rich repeat (LRR) protein